MSCGTILHQIVPSLDFNPTRAATCRPQVLVFIILFFLHSYKIDHTYSESLDRQQAIASSAVLFRAPYSFAMSPKIDRQPLTRHTWHDKHVELFIEILRNPANQPVGGKRNAKIVKSTITLEPIQDKLNELTPP